MQSQLNSYLWQKCLQVIRIISSLFKSKKISLFDRKCKLGIYCENHNSVLASLKEIESYTKEEMSFGAIYGPYQDAPFQNFHASPIMIREIPRT